MSTRSRFAPTRLFLLACALLPLGTLGAAERPNILFIFSDDHAPNAIGAYRGWLQEINPTPNIDQLAREGMLFENSFCTNSICGPSRAVILTGKHSHLNGFRQNGDRFDGSQQTFPKILQKAGYQTAIVGKWHLVTDPTGFDYWEVLPGQGAYYNPHFLTPEGRVQREGHCTDVVTERAIRWLTSVRDDDKPFLLMCQHKAPHRTWMPAKRHLNLYDDIEIPEPDTLFDDWSDNVQEAAARQEMTIADHMNLVYDLKLSPAQSRGDGQPRSLDKSGARNLQRMTPEQRSAWNAAYDPKNQAFAEANLEGRDLVRWKYQRYMKDYLRCVKGVDESIGAIRKALETLGLADNTIVIYSSDQGFYLGEHGWYDKRWMYEESLMMPLVVHWPGVTKPQARVEQMVQNLDYGPTFLDVADAPIPDDMQGHSLVPLLQGEAPSDWRKSLYYHYYEHPGPHMVAKHYGIRTERYKLIYFYELDAWEFYDLQEDPDELLNVYNDSKHRELISTLKAELGELRAAYQDVDPAPAG